jgi:hypothetical protein
VIVKEGVNKPNHPIQNPLLLVTETRARGNVIISSLKVCGIVNSFVTSLAFEVNVFISLQLKRTLDIPRELWSTFCAKINRVIQTMGDKLVGKCGVYAATVHVVIMKFTGFQ